VFLIKLLKLSQRQQLSIMQQSGASAAVRWHKLREVDDEYNLHNYIALAICMPKNYQIWCRLNEVLTKKLGHFLTHLVHEW